MRKHLEFLEGGEALVAFQLKDLQGIDAWNRIVVVMNFNKEARQVAVPEGKYTVVCRNGKIDENGLGQEQGREVTVEGQKALVMYQK